VTVRLDDSVIKFPPYDMVRNGILAIGGNLSKEWLILAYTKGIFPFFNSDSDEISWWFPETRAVMEPGDMKVNKSLKKCINKKKFQIKADQNFSKVIKLCASTRRAYRGTWITENMIDAYCKLHQCNIAHSIEVNASKVAFYYLNKYLLEKKFDLIDCQFVNEHLLSLGAKVIDSDKFLKILNSAVAKNELDKKWNVNF